PEEGTVFAFQVLPVIVFFAALTAVLYYVGALQLVTRWIGGALAKVLGTTGPESMNAAANIFVGQTEAPLVIRPYIKDMTPSEIFAVMAGGLTTVAGSVLVGYSLLGANLEYLIAASFMAAPAGLLMARMLVPAGALADTGPTAEPTAPSDAPATDTADDGAPADSRGGSRLAAAFRRGSRRGGTHEGRDELVRRARGEDAPEEDEEEPPVNVIDAAARGASDGLTL